MGSPEPESQVQKHSLGPFVIPCPAEFGQDTVCFVPQVPQELPWEHKYRQKPGRKEEKGTGLFWLGQSW